MAITYYATEGLNEAAVGSVQQGFSILLRGLGVDLETGERIVEDLVRRLVTDGN